MSFPKDKYCIVGIGETAFTRESGKSLHALAAEASRNAILDAGLGPKDINGVACYMDEGDSERVLVTAGALGIRMDHYYDMLGGGSCGEAMIGLAVAAMNAGLCETMVLYRAFNGRSGRRIGKGGEYGKQPRIGGEREVLSPFGLGPPVQRIATLAQRHMFEYGTTSEQLGAIALTCRKHAQLNPRAQMYGKPMTMQDYLNSRMISYPFHVFDCCLETDGGCAMVVTSAERARNLKQRPVYISGVAARASHGSAYTYDLPSITTTAFAYAAPRLYGMAGVTPKDIDVAFIYDAFTWVALVALEDMGFCKKGEGGPFVEGGSRIQLGGQIPINTAGGLLSEAYINGFNGILEVVRQLRGECGERQVKNAEFGLTTGAARETGASAMILRRL